MDEWVIFCIIKLAFITKSIGGKIECRDKRNKR